MKQAPRLQKILLPAVGVMVGLIAGLGIGQLQVSQEQKIFQDKLRDANRKIAFVQKKMSDEKTEATASLEQRFQADMDLIQNEKKGLEEQVRKLKEQARTLEAKAAETEANLKEQARTLEAKAAETEKKLKQQVSRLEARGAETEAKLKEQVRVLEVKLKQTEEGFARTKKELQAESQKLAQVAQQYGDLEREQRKMAAEKQALKAQLERTERNFEQCEMNNARLCIIAEDVVNAYRNKRIGTILLEKEPLTQIKKVELEHLAQRYREEIEQQRVRKK